MSSISLTLLFILFVRHICNSSGALTAQRRPSDLAARRYFHWDCSFSIFDLHEGQSCKSMTWSVFVQPVVAKTKKMLLVVVTVGVFSETFSERSFKLCSLITSIELYSFKCQLCRPWPNLKLDLTILARSLKLDIFITPVECCIHVLTTLSLCDHDSLPRLEDVFFCFQCEWMEYLLFLFFLFVCSCVCVFLCCLGGSLFVCLSVSCMHKCTNERTNKLVTFNRFEQIMWLLYAKVVRAVHFLWWLKALSIRCVVCTAWLFRLVLVMMWLSRNSMWIK